MLPVLTLTLKDLRLLWRDRFALFWVFGFPLLLGLMFGAAFGDGGNRGRLTLAIVDEDQSSISGELAAKLREHTSVRLIDAETLKVPVLDVAAAANAVRLGKLTAFVVLKKGFGDSLFAFGSTNSTMEIGIDPSRKAEGGFLQGILMETRFTLLAQQFMDPKVMKQRLKQMLDEITQAPDLNGLQKQALTVLLSSVRDFMDKLEVNKWKAENPFGNMGIKTVDIAQDKAQPRSSWEITFPSSILWGVLGCMVSFAVSLVVERREGTLLRLRIAPLYRWQVLAGKGMACFVGCVAAAVVLLVIGRICFHIRIPSLPLLGLAIGSTAFCFTGIMMFLSVLGRTEQAVSGSASAIMLVMSMFGGGMIPLAFMPEWMAMASNASPVKWGILALEGAIWRSFTLQEMLWPCGVLLGVGLLAFLIGAAMLQKRDF